MGNQKEIVITTRYKLLRGPLHSAQRSFCMQKPLAGRAVPKKAYGDNEGIQTPFAVMKVRSANCIREAKEGH